MFNMISVKAVRMAAALFFFMGTPLFLAAQGNLLDQARIAFSNKEYPQAAEYFKQVLQSDPENKAVLVETGDTYMELEYFDTAATYYQRAYDEDSKNGDINRKLGTALSLAGDHTAAIEKLRRAYKYDDQSLSSRLALANGYLRIGTDSLNQAELLILNTDDKFPENPVVKVALGDLYYTRKIYDLAQQYYNEAIELDENLVEPRIQLGETYIALALRGASNSQELNKLYGQALEQFNKVTKLEPKNAPAWRRQGEIFYQAQRYEDAISSFLQYVKLRPDDPRGDIYLARLWAEVKNPANAIQYAERILQRTDEASREEAPQAKLTIARGLYLKGQLAKNEENIDSARYYYTEASKAYTKVPQAALDINDYVFQGTALMWGGDTTQGVAMWKQSITAFPDSCMSSFNLGRTLFSMKRYNDVIDFYTARGTACTDNQSSVFLLSGLSHLAMDQGEQAVSFFNKVIESDSTNIDGYYWLMNALTALKQTENISTIFEAMIRNVPADSDSSKLAAGYYFNGTAKFNAKDFKGAIEDLEKAVEIKPDYALAYLFIAVSYHSLKDKANACQYYRKTLQYDPENKTAQGNLNKLGC